MNAPLTVSSPDSDLLSNKALAAYFNAREQEVYFHSLRHVDDRRSFYPRIVAALDELLAFFDDAAKLELLDAWIFRHREKVEKIMKEAEQIKEKAEKTLQGSEILDCMKELNCRGFELLELNGPEKFDSLLAAFASLKAARNSVAFNYHPDRGGSNEDMRLVLEAHNQFHEIISRWRWTEAPGPESPSECQAPKDSSEAPLGPTAGHPGFEFEIRSAMEYLNWLGAILVTVHTDIWAVDKAYCVLTSLSDHGLLSQRFTHDENFLGYFARPLFRLAERLHTAHLVAEARFVQNHAVALFDRLSQVYPNVDLGQGLGAARASSVLSGEEKLRIVIKHPCQGETR